jgi:holo-[acyl-carrier protein] synthase
VFFLNFFSYGFIIKKEMLMIKGIGTDIIEIDRIENIMGKSNFINRCFTENEIEYLRNKNPESTAGYFCAKEAVSKALGTGFSGFCVKDIEIIKKDSAPFIVLHNKALEIADGKGIKNIHISISHCRDYAIAYAVAEG